MSIWRRYHNERMLMHAGLLRESDDPFEDLMGEYSDAYKAVFVGKPSAKHLNKISRLSVEEINNEINSLYQYAESVAAAEMEAEEREAEKRAYDAEIAALMPSTEERNQERVPVGLVPFWKNETKMKLTKSQLQKIIKEEVSRVLNEVVDVINAETTELLRLPPDLVGSYTHGQEIPDAEFSRLRSAVYAFKKVETPRSSYADDDLDLDDEKEIDAAWENLKAAARDAAEDWLSDNPGSEIGDVALDLAAGIKWKDDSTDWSSDWSLGIKRFGDEKLLISALAETMTG